MGKISLLILVIAVAGNLSFAQEQQVKPLKKEQSEQLKKVDGSTFNSMFHKFVCRRCGSENQIDWGLNATTNKEGPGLIPHCGFCGKKYWPKFKPSGFLERTYCSQRPPNLYLN